MKPSLILPLLAAALVMVPLHSEAATTVFQIGVEDNNQAEFEQESDAYNNAQYYVHAGNYTAVAGKAGNGGVWSGAQEILSDGPTAAEWSATPDGFPRALVPGRPVIDIYFQMSAVIAQSPSLQFETKLFGLGGNSVHDVTIFLNGAPIFTQTGIAAEVPVSVSLPKSGFTYNEGGNVISFQRTGGIETNPWIQLDFVRLNAIPEPSAALLSVLALAGAGLRRRRSA